MIENPPESYNRLYFQRLADELKALFAGKDELPKTLAMPTKPKEGKLYYFPNTIAPTITTVGVWVYKSTGWSYLG